MIKEHKNQYPNFIIYRATGPAEHWLTAIEKLVWGFERKYTRIHRSLKQGDILIFHSTQSFFTRDCGIIGFGVVNGTKVKDEFWWKQEIDNNENRWPNVILFNKIFLLGDRTKIKIEKSIQDKSDNDIDAEIKALLKNRISFEEISQKFGNFPKQGSVSRLKNINDEAFVDFIANKATQVDNIKDEIADENPVGYTEDDEGFDEGKKALKSHLVRERNQRVIAKAKEKMLSSVGRLECQVCGFIFKNKYGELGKDYIEGHHLKPVSELKEGEKTNTSDIALVCSNCHRMLHRKRPWLKIDGLKELLLAK